MRYVTAIFHYTIILCVTVQEWIQENDVLSIVLRDSLHQPQYVEKLEKILRFMIKEKALSLQNLDKLWEAQVGWFVCVFTLFSTLKLEYLKGSFLIKEKALSLQNLEKNIEGPGMMVVDMMYWEFNQ